MKSKNNNEIMHTAHSTYTVSVSYRLFSKIQKKRDIRKNKSRHRGNTAEIM